MAFGRFTQIIECMFQLQKFLQKLDELVGKMSYENDPILVRKPPLKSRVDTLLTHLIKRYTQSHTQQHIHDSLFMHMCLIIYWCVFSSFVVETQPSMPQGRGPLVLRTNVQFSVKVRSGSNIIQCITPPMKQWKLVLLLFTIAIIIMLRCHTVYCLWHSYVLSNIRKLRMLIHFSLLYMTPISIKELST